MEIAQEVPVSTATRSFVNVIGIVFFPAPDIHITPGGLLCVEFLSIYHPSILLSTYLSGPYIF